MALAGRPRSAELLAANDKHRTNLARPQKKNKYVDRKCSRHALKRIVNFINSM